MKQRDFVHAVAALGSPPLQIEAGLRTDGTRLPTPAAPPRPPKRRALDHRRRQPAVLAVHHRRERHGCGEEAPTPAWDSMLWESRDFLYVAWWLAALPGALWPSPLSDQRARQLATRYEAPGLRGCAMGCAG